MLDDEAIAMLADTGTFLSVDVYDGEWALEHGVERALAGRHDAQARETMETGRAGFRRPSSSASGSRTGPTAACTRTSSYARQFACVRALRA